MDPLWYLQGYGSDVSTDCVASAAAFASGNATPPPCARAGATTPTEKHPSPRTASAPPRAAEGADGGDPADTEVPRPGSFDDEAGHGSGSDDSVEDGASGGV